MTRRTILMYHRVDRDGEDPYPLCVAPDRFEDQLRTVAEVADVVDLDHLAAGLRRPFATPAGQGVRRRPRPQVVVTLDDGYADNLLEALPVAEALGVAFTVFVATGRLDSPDGYWWHRLALLLQGRDEVRLDVTVGKRPLRISLRGPEAAPRSLVALHTRLRLRPVEEIEAVLATIADQLSVPMPVPARARAMTTDELRRLAASPLVTIGAHTVDHVLLAGRSRAEQVDTIGRSKADLEAVLDRPVRHFAYPYGDGEAFDATSVEAARRCGFTTACTTLAGRVTFVNDPFRLPRRMVRDWTAEEMAAQLSAWRAA